MARRPILALAAFALSMAPALADEWRNLTGPEIAEALTGRTLDYDGAWQDFRASGATLYNAGADSWGTWTTRGDQYCSQWPPSATWACYDVALRTDGQAVRFSGLPGDVTIGTYRKR